MLRPREEGKENNRIHEKINKRINRKSERIRAWKAKGLIAIALLLWGMSAISLCVNTWKGTANQEDVVNAFSDMVYSDLTATIRANGYYGNMELSQTAKYIILEDIAKEIGINRYEISSDEEGCISLSQNSANGAVLLKLITVSESAQGETLIQNQYLCVNITLAHSIRSTNTYREIVEGIMEEYKIKTNVNVDLGGTVAGRMQENEMVSLKKTLMEEIGGKTKFEKNTEDIYTVYGYDKDIEAAILMGKEKVNVNITMSYNEIADQTEIHLSTPINNQDY